MIAIPTTLSDVAPYLFALVIVALIHVGVRRLMKSAPSLDGLFGGEELIDSMRASLSIDGSVKVPGFVYLTDFRVVWVPTVHTPFRHLWHLPAVSTANYDAFMFNLSEVRRVATRWGLFSSRLTLVTPAGEYRFQSEAGGFGGWLKYMIVHCRNLLREGDELVPSTRRARFDDDLVQMASRTSASAMILMGFIALLQTLPLLGDLPGLDNLPAEAVGVLGLGLAILGYAVWHIVGR